ncbi:hypothetical protein JCGZ_10436 [Jatropha curcas]|uniref:Uncharacterized protein n=1 Tax=Jatropha curcas TaxID=180498 RepID=A0A067KU59_JATCU|nr:hypothetical protein JCGZ_10436 [Jatropha curcas]
MARSQRLKGQRAKDLREVLEAKRAKRALSNGDYKAEAQVPKREAPPSSLGSRIEIENFTIQANLSVSSSASVNSMPETSIPVSDIEKMGESERSEHVDDTWQEEEYYAKKMPAKKTRPELVVSKKFEKLDKKLERLHVFMKSKVMDQYVDIVDDDDEKLKLKHTIHLTYKMPKRYGKVRVLP